MEPLQQTAVDLRKRVGEVLQRTWRINALLGVGSTAAVYRAAAPSGEPVAVKVLHVEYARDETMRARFAREANVAKLIAHPGAVQILAEGETVDGAPFLVMELLEGETLEARWERKKRKLPMAEVLWYADNVLDVLAKAHGVGVVHRDIKPENVFLTGSGSVKLLDFGLARLRSQATTSDDDEQVEPVTRAGSLMGTLAFMPPEQARGETDAVGVQTDLWAVGATMFTLLTGQLVHPGEEFQALLDNAAKREPTSLATVAPDLPNAVVELVDFALSFDASKRWKDAQTMQRAVREVHGILVARSARESNAEGALGFDDDDGTMSERVPQFRARHTPVDPPPLSRSRTAETLPPTGMRDERERGLDPPPALGQQAALGRPRALVVGVAIAIGAVLLVALWSTWHP